MSYRFRATESSALQDIAVYILDQRHPGYGGGTGGSLRIQVRSDDGTAEHAPSGTVLATVNVADPGDGPGAQNVYAFPSPATLVAGRLYHIVFTNTDPNPTVNYVSLDGLFVFSETARWQPAFSNTDWANLIRYGSGAWEQDRGSGQGIITPIMQLDYANGQHAGVGYMEVWVGMHKTISGSAKAREAFTVSGPDRRVSSVSVRLERVSGSSPLAVRLEKGDGTLVASGSIPASAIPVGDPTRRGRRPAGPRSTSAQPVTLQSGQRYHLVLSSSADTDYSIFVIRKGSSYGFSPQTYFSDGLAQYTTGSGWTGFDGWSGPSNEGDLQLYFQ